VKRQLYSHLSNASLMQEFATRLARDRAVTAEFIGCLAEVDRRKLCRPAGYRSTYAWCVGHFHLSEGAAYKRIRAARLIRKFPAVYEALAEGHVHLSGLVLLVQHLKDDNVDELLAAVTHKSRAQIEKLLAKRFPKADVPTVVVELSAPVATTPELSPGTVSDNSLALGSAEASTERPAHAAVVPAPPAVPEVIRARVAPLSAKRYAIQFTMDEATHDLLRKAQDLLGHQVAPGDIAEVFGRALKAYVAQLERTKFSATDRPQARCRPTASGSRHVPARVKRAVHDRDGGQCTFVSESGHRCESRSDLEFDHVKEFARGGEATVDNIRLRCRDHNQFTAEQTFGAGFMEEKRDMRRSRRERRPNSARAM